MGRRERAQRVLSVLGESMGSPTTELEHSSPYELIVSVILSAQCTDERVNRVTPALFAAYPDVHALAAAEPEDVLGHVRSISYPNSKARHLVAMARRVRDRFGGRVPESVEDLQTLAGVGRKTALVVASVAHGTDAIPVDTHVFRVAHRLGLVRRDASTPAAVERDLRRVLPRSEWSRAHHLLILHGRYTCRARDPGCSGCPLSGGCPFREAVDALPGPVEGLDARRGRFWCGTRHHYFDRPNRRTDRAGVEQPACPRCGSMNVYDSRTGTILRRVRDPRANTRRRTTRPE
jgi:endonuclease-3